MDVTQLPFHRFLGMERCAPDSGHLVSLPAGDDYTNHLGTVHAAALLAVAEAGSAEFLLRQVGEVEGFVPVVRRLEAKFRTMARGRISARASIEAEALPRLHAEMQAKGRALITVRVEVVDESGTVALSAAVEWFVARSTPRD